MAHGNQRKGDDCDNGDYESGEVTCDSEKKVNVMVVVIGKVMVCVDDMFLFLGWAACVRVPLREADQAGGGDDQEPTLPS